MCIKIWVCAVRTKGFHSSKIYFVSSIAYQYARIVILHKVCVWLKMPLFGRLGAFWSEFICWFACFVFSSGLPIWTCVSPRWVTQTLQLSESESFNVLDFCVVACVSVSVSVCMYYVLCVSVCVCILCLCTCVCARVLLCLCMFTCVCFCVCVPLCVCVCLSVFVCLSVSVYILVTCSWQDYYDYETPHTPTPLRITVYFFSHFCSFLLSFFLFFYIFLGTKGFTRNIFYFTFPRTKTSFSRKLFPIKSEFNLWEWKNILWEWKNILPRWPCG